MSVMMLSEKSIKNISIFLIETFNPERITQRSHFQLWNAEDDYPELYKFMKGCRVSDEQGNIPWLLYDMNETAYVERYKDEKKDSILFSDLKRIPTQWFFDFANVTDIQMHKTFSCYLYQIERESAFIKELEKLNAEFGNWITGQSKEWNEAKWE